MGSRRLRGAGAFPPWAGACVFLLTLASCTTPGETPQEGDRIASAGPSDSEGAIDSPSPIETLPTSGGCDGLARPRSGGEITFIRDDRLWAVSASGKGERCLADLSTSNALRSPPFVSWNGPADRVIVGDRALSRDLGETPSLTGQPFAAPLWSRPNGTSVVYITRSGRLMKRSSFGGRATDISFLSRHDDVTYHPAGEHIATTGLAEDGSYGLYLATNVGTEPKLLARGEQARFIVDLAFAQDGVALYYSARHGPRNWHLHRLNIGEEATLETLDKNDFGFDVAVSQVEEFGPYAWSSVGDCAAGETDRLHVVGARIKVPSELEETSLQPIGWLPKQRLVVTSGPVSCSTATPSVIYVLAPNRAPVLIAQGVGITAAVRATLPPPPPPPGEEQEVVA